MKDKEVIKDENRMIEKLEEHRDLVDLVERIGIQNGVDARRTVKNNPNGDIVFPAHQTKEFIKILGRYFKK